MNYRGGDSFRENWNRGTRIWDQGSEIEELKKNRQNGNLISNY